MDTNNVERFESHLQSHDDDHESLPIKGTCNFIRSCFNGVNTLSGVGIVSVPYAVSKGGWLSLVLLVLVAVLCFYTGILVQRCMDSDPLIRSYPDIGHVAFGRKGRALVSTLLYLELFFVAVEFLIMEGDNLHKLFPIPPKENASKLVVGGKLLHETGWFVLLTALVVLPTTWLRSLDVLAYVSAGGVLASLILVLAVFWGGAFDGIGFHHQTSGELWNWTGFPTAISLFTFCYCGHAVFPTICNSMKDKSQFPKVLLVCFIVSTMSYGSMAIFGYLMFGEDLTSQVTLNLPTKNISSKIAIYTTLVNPISKYALVLSPIATAVEEALPCFQGSSKMMMSCLIRTCLVMSTVFVALVVPYFGYLMTFIGAFLSISVSILFPCLCYCKIVIGGFNKIRVELMVIFIILLFGTFVAILGTYTALTDIIKEVQSK